MIVRLACGTCGHPVTATSAQAVSDAYFDHRHAVHGLPNVPPMMTALALLAKATRG